MAQGSATIKDISTALKEGRRRLEICGLKPSAAGYALARLWQELRRPLLVVVPTPELQDSFSRDLRFFLRDSEEDDPALGPVFSFPAYEELDFVDLAPDCLTPSRRLAAAYVLGSRRGLPVVVASALALLQPLPPRDRLAGLTEYLLVGAEVERDKLVEHLEAGGYQRRALVEEPGEYSVRGGVLDFFPPLAPHPIRVEFWGDTWTRSGNSTRRASGP